MRTALPHDEALSSTLDHRTKAAQVGIAGEWDTSIQTRKSGKGTVTIPSLITPTDNHESHAVPPPSKPSPDDVSPTWWRHIASRVLTRATAWECVHAGMIAAVVLAVAAALSGPQPIVTIHARNESGLQVDTIHFNFNNGDMAGELIAAGLAPNLAPNVTKDFGLYVPSEGTLTMQARFADGVILVSDAVYLERGDALLVQIDAGKICLRQVDSLLKRPAWFGGQALPPSSCDRL